MTHPTSGSRGLRLPRDERRRQLLQAAQDVFVAHGYHAAAMDDIAERAGVSKPVLYQHFPGKLELYLGLLDTHIEHLVRRIRDAMESTSDNRSRVEGAIGAYFDFVDVEGEAFRLVFESDLRNEPAVRDRVRAGVADCVEAIADSIAAETGSGQALARLLSVGLTGLAEMSARWWLERRGDGAAGGSSDPEITKAEAVALMSRLAWRGISGIPRQDEAGAGDLPGSPSA